MPDAGSAGVSAPALGRSAHHLSPRALDALAGGPGDRDAVGELTEMQQSVTRALVAAVAGRADGRPHSGLRDAAAEGWKLLCALDRSHPDAVRAIFAHPYVSAWAYRCLTPSPGADADLDLAHLAGLAAAAALRAGVDADLPLPVRDGLLHLPAVGAAVLDAPARRTEVLSVRAGGRTVARSGRRWLETRYVHAAPFARLAVEDLDPFRDCQEWPAADRLTERAWKTWQHSLAAAAQRLRAAVPGYAGVLPTGLRAVAPLQPGEGADRGATARQAFGAVAVALPGSPVRLAGLILHEFQHVKLNAVLDLIQVVDSSCPSRLRVPWRQDPRPLEGVLHGTYAYLALTHLCQAQGPGAREDYLRYRSWVTEAAAALMASGALTEAGTRFVMGMAVSAETGSG